MLARVEFQCYLGLRDVNVAGAQACNERPQHFVLIGDHHDLCRRFRGFMPSVRAKEILAFVVELYHRPLNTWSDS